MRIFSIAKDSHIFPTKNNSVFVIHVFTFKILTKCELTLSLISNNRAQLSHWILMAEMRDLRLICASEN